MKANAFPRSFGGFPRKKGLDVKGKRVVLGVSGGIAAYKALELTRLFVKSGVEVRVVMTPNATKFVGPMTFRELSGHSVAIEMFEEPRWELMQHLSLTEWADLVVVAPATANVINKMACGIGDNLLMTMLLATTAPILLAPAMDSDMYTNPVTQENIRKLKGYGVHFIGPEVGQLARGNVGLGRMVEPEDIFNCAVTLLSEQTKAQGMKRETNRSDMTGVKVTVTAGPTQEAIDPVRYLTNRSSGKMGFSLAKVAAERGACVTLISGPTSLATPQGVKKVDVKSADQMLQAVLKQMGDTDILIKAAAPADFMVKEISKEKIKKTDSEGITLQLVKTEDILKKVGQQKKPHQVIVGFAAETENLLQYAQQKLVEKNCDLLVANDLSQAGAGFEVDTNIVHILDQTGKVESFPLLTKEEVAEIIINRALELFKQKVAGGR
jgi:phosphopantothenoylcysteine decarboxylase/phosphopantothenate--cysteine ligase